MKINVVFLSLNLLNEHFYVVKRMHQNLFTLSECFAFKVKLLKINTIIIKIFLRLVSHLIPDYFYDN